MLQLYDTFCYFSNYRQKKCLICLNYCIPKVRNEMGSYRFSLLGDVKTIFNTPSMHANIGSTYGPCKSADTRGYFDSSSGNFIIKVSDFFDDNTFPSESEVGGSCPDSIDPSSFGYSKDESTGYDFEITFDSRSIVLALSVNLGILDITALEIGINDGNDFISSYCNGNENTCNGLSVDAYSQYFSVAESYLGMEPIYCASFSFEHNMVGASCFIRKGDTMLLPTVNHFNDCSDCEVVMGNEDLLATCNEHNILVGLFYVPNESIDYFPVTAETASQFKKLLVNDDGSDNAFNIYAYDATKITIDGAFEDSRPSDGDVIDIFNDLCPNEDCSMIVFGSSGGSSIINMYHLQIPAMACKSTIYDAGHFDNIYSTFGNPLSLHERYQECHLELFDNLVFAVGISTGNASVFCSFIMCCLFFVLGRYLKHTIGYETGFADTPEQAEERKRQEKMERERIAMEKKGSTEKKGIFQSPSSSSSRFGLEDSLAGVLGAEIDAIGKEERLIEINKEMVLDLHTRINELESSVRQQQKTIEYLVRIKGDISSDLNSMKSPSINGSFSTSKSTNRRYTAEEHKAMHEFLRSKLPATDKD